jgi:hypothetical protein
MEVKQIRGGILMKLVIKVVLAGFIIVFTGCVSIDDTYKGKVVDAETQLPIVGAVVHASWHKRYIGGGSEYFSSYEVLTDYNGDFNIPGQGFLVGTVLSHVEGAMLTIFKAGYEELGPAYWWGLKGGSYKMVSWNGNRGIFKLRRMTLEERLERGVNLPGSEPDSKQKLLRVEINKENTQIGRGPSSLYPVE